MHYKPTIGEKALFRVILKLKTATECRNFLRDLLTLAELKEFANRWQVAQMLNKKVDYKTIRKETNMSSTTIARVGKWLAGGMGGYRLMLKRLGQNSADSHHNRETRLAV
ncbi:hypothetical protein HYU92_03475 [Candidatus Curtissbacteria bacterium]|nr:hypothetical protein [Candidatus Curtissbacteria bacterium]